MRFGGFQISVRVESGPFVRNAQVRSGYCQLRVLVGNGNLSFRQTRPTSPCNSHLLQDITGIPWPRRDIFSLARQEVSPFAAWGVEELILWWIFWEVCPSTSAQGVLSREMCRQGCVQASLPDHLRSPTPLATRTR